MDISKAVERIGAIKVAEGKYAHYDPPTGLYWAVGVDAMQVAQQMIETGSWDYKQWCKDTEGVELPSRPEAVA